MKEQKLHYEEYQIPPYSQEHLRALFLEYVSRGMFQLPVHHESVMNKIRTLYQNIQNSDIYMKELDLARIIRELVSKYMCAHAGTSSRSASSPMGLNWSCSSRELTSTKLRIWLKSHVTSGPSLSLPIPSLFNSRKRCRPRRKRNLRNK